MSSFLDATRARHPGVPDAVVLKAEVMFRGVRYGAALERAAPAAMPSYYPYRRPPPEGATKGATVSVPYIFDWPDGTSARLRIDDDSPYEVRDDEGAGGSRLFEVPTGRDLGPVGFTPRPAWMTATLPDGSPGARSGLAQHGGMVVVNAAPGCDYFTQRTDDGASMRCTFCAYGRWDARTQFLGQEPFHVDIPAATLARARDALRLAAPEARQVYLVGGSMLDPADEARRYVPLVAACREAAPDAFLACGSGAVDREWTEAYRRAGADGVSYNLEVWHAGAFAAVCPGKDRYVGRARWLRALSDAVEVCGRGNVLSAMVAGVELYPPSPLAGDPQAALQSALEGARWMIGRGIQPVYSPFWPVPGTPYHDDQEVPLNYFLDLAAGVHRIRVEARAPLPARFVDRAASYMQIEADMDHALGVPA
jgi:hypothetical protein